MAKVQYITDESGKVKYAVLPIEEYQHLLITAQSYEDLPYNADHTDNETVPDPVVQLMIAQQVSLLAAWRLYRGLSQYDVAEKLGTTQSAISQLEAQGSKPQKKTRVKLAALYQCRPEQMVL